MVKHHSSLIFRDFMSLLTVPFHLLGRFPSNVMSATALIFVPYLLFACQHCMCYTSRPIHMSAVVSFPHVLYYRLLLRCLQPRKASFAVEGTNASTPTSPTTRPPLAPPMTVLVRLPPEGALSSYRSPLRGRVRLFLIM